MLIDLPLLTSAMLAMLACAVIVDFVCNLTHSRAGSASERFTDRLLVNVLFFALLPGALYGWLFPLVPFSGWRAGGFIALFLYALAVMPTFAAFRLQTGGREPVTAGYLFWLLVKYVGVYALLTFIYNP